MEPLICWIGIFVLCLTRLVSSESCNHRCLEDNSCSNTVIDCNSDKCSNSCNIECIGAESCDNLTILQNHENPLTNLQCSGTNTCKNIKFIGKNDDNNSDNNGFICDCIPYNLYNSYRESILGMINYLKKNNYFLFDFGELLETIINLKDDDLKPKLINNNENDSDSDDLPIIDYLVDDILRYNDKCEGIDEYILSHLDEIPSSIDIICSLNGKHYKLLDYLGDGSYVFVIRGECIETNEVVAIKFIDTMHHKCDDDLTKKEIESHIYCNKVIDNLSVKLLDVSSDINNILYNDNDDNDVYRIVIIMEYIPDGEISKYIRDYISDDIDNLYNKQEEFAQFMTCRMLDDTSYALSLLYDHDDRKYLHNDIKPANILFNFHKMSFKLADFGHMMTVTYLLNKTNEFTALGTPNYIGITMSDLFGWKHNYNKYLNAYNFYIKYPQNGDLYQLLSSALSLYNTICDPNNNINEYCDKLNDNKLELDVNAEYSLSSFMLITDDNEDDHGLLYVVNKERHKRLMQLKNNYNTTGTSIFNLIHKYLTNLHNDYYNNYRYNENQTNYNEIQNKYDWNTFRNDLNNVCADYIIQNRNNNNNDFIYQLWQYDDDNRVVLKRFYNKTDDISDICFVDNKNENKKYILYNRENNQIISPKKNNLNNFHYQLKNHARIFNDNHYNNNNNKDD